MTALPAEPVGASGVPTRSQIDSFTHVINGLSASAVSWRTAAGQFESAVDTYAQQISAPGGTEWEGDAADAAQASAYADRGVVYQAADHLRDMASVASRGAQNLQGAQLRALDAIADAEHDDFVVSDDLTVTDQRTYTSDEIDLYQQRQAQAAEHQDYIVMRARALPAEQSAIDAKLETGAGTLHGMIPQDWNAQHGKGAIQAVDFKQGPGKKQDESDHGDKEDDKKHGGSKSWGKGSKTHIQPHGDQEKQWGHPTDPHEVWPNVPHKTGTFDGDHGSWEWHGPGRQGEAYGSQHSDGVTGNAGVDAWAVKGEGHWSRDVFGHPLTASANGEVGAHAGADATITDHGVSLGGDAFVGAELGGKVDYPLGPVDLSLGGAAQVGAGGSAHLDIGMEDGKFVLGGTLGAAWGLGGKISPHIAVDPNAVVRGVESAGKWLSGLFH
jgi:hypothetical protein